MLKAKIDKDNNVICPNCDRSEYDIFRRDNLGEGTYLNHCKCGCGQLFAYKVDKQNIAVIE